jgi:hypothetical protein
VTSIHTPTVAREFARESWTPVLREVALPLISGCSRRAGPFLQQHGRPGLPRSSGRTSPKSIGRPGRPCCAGSCLYQHWRPGLPHSPDTTAVQGTRVVLGRAHSSTGVLDSRGVWGCTTPHTTVAQGALVVLGHACNITGVLDSRGVWGCTTHHTTVAQGALVVLGHACNITGVLDSRGVWGRATPHTKVPALCWAMPAASRASWTPVVCGVALPLIPRYPRCAGPCLQQHGRPGLPWCVGLQYTYHGRPGCPRCAGPCLQHHGRPGLPWCVGSRHPSYQSTRVVLGHACSITGVLDSRGVWGRATPHTTVPALCWAMPTAARASWTPVVTHTTGVQDALVVLGHACNITGVLDSRGHTPRESRTPSLCWAMPATSRASWTPVVCRVALPLIPKYPRCAGPCLQHHGRPGLPWCVRSRYPSYHGTRVVLGRAYSSTGVLDSRGVWGCNTPHTTAVQGALVCWAMPATSRASWTPVVFGVALPPRAWPSGTPVVSWLMAAYLAP